MKLLSRIASVVALALSLTVPALAQDLTDAQRQGLADRIESFDAAMRSNDMSVIMGVVPPQVLEAIATQYGATSDQLVEAAQQQLDAAMQAVTLVSFDMDLEGAEFATLSDGMHYAMIPTETVMDLGASGGKVKATSSTLGLLDGETWYLVRVEDAAQVGILQQVYPAFSGVTFPTGSMEPISE